MDQLDEEIRCHYQKVRVTYSVSLPAWTTVAKETKFSVPVWHSTWEGIHDEVSG